MAGWSVDHTCSSFSLATCRSSHGAVQALGKERQVRTSYGTRVGIPFSPGRRSKGLTKEWSGFLDTQTKTRTCNPILPHCGAPRRRDCLEHNFRLCTSTSWSYFFHVNSVLVSRPGTLLRAAACFMVVSYISATILPNLKFTNMKKIHTF